MLTESQALSLTISMGLPTRELPHGYYPHILFVYEFTPNEICLH